MEYLMTYGWAILVIVIVLAALLYLGVFNVGERVPEQCNFKVGILCTSAKVVVDDITLNLRNGLGNKIVICAITCDDTETADSLAAITVADCGTTNLGDLDVGQTGNFASGAGCTDAAGAADTVGDRYRGKVFVQYYEQGDTGNARIAQGDLQAVVQP